MRGRDGVTPAERLSARPHRDRRRPVHLVTRAPQPDHRRPRPSPPTLRPPPPAATSNGQLHKLAFPALGTTCEVQYATPGSSRPMAAFECAAVSWVQAFEAKYSRFQPDSLVSRINAAAGRDWVEVDEDTEEIAQALRHASRHDAGACSTRRRCR